MQEIKKASEATEARTTIRENESKDTDNSLLSKQISINISSLEENNLMPIWGLPSLLQGVINEYTDVYGIPRDFITAAILSATASASRKKIKLCGKYDNYPQLFAVFVAHSGTGKSAPIKFAYQPIKDADKESYHDFQAKVKEWENIEGNQSPRPEYKQILIQDTTIEALFKVLKCNRDGITLCRDELSGWFSDFGRYNKSGEIGHYLSLFDGEQIIINRKCEDPTLISDPFFNVIGSIQPEVLAQTLSANNMSINGFAQRFLYVYPDAFLCPEYSEKEMSDEGKEAYRTYLNNVLTMDLDGNVTEFKPDAKKEYIKFYNELQNLKNNTLNDYERAIYAKMDIHCLRLALTVYLTKWGAGEPDSGLITLETIRYAIALCRYFLSTALRVREMSVQPEKKITKQEILCALNELYPIKNKQALADAIGVSRPLVSRALKGGELC